jgi:dTMP kinase
VGQEALTRGRFLTVEGGEGAGKSTHVGLLVAALARAGIPALRTREPGGAPGAEDIRKLLVEGEPGRWDAPSEALLMAAARRCHLTATVWPALAQGTWVVSDRFADSTLAYQGSAGGVPRADLEALHRIIAGDFAPDLTLILDLPIDLGLARAAARAGAETRFERKDRAFHERLRQGFLDIAAREPKRCVMIDATGDVDAVHQAVLAAVRERLTSKV